MVVAKYTKIQTDQEQATVEELHVPSSHLSDSPQEQTYARQHEANDLLSEDDGVDDCVSSQHDKKASSGTENGRPTATRIRMPLKSKIAQNVMQTTIATLGLILFYFALSIGLTFYQRWLLNVSKIFMSLLLHSVQC